MDAIFLVGMVYNIARQAFKTIYRKSKNLNSVSIVDIGKETPYFRKSF